MTGIIFDFVRLGSIAQKDPYKDAIKGYIELKQRDMNDSIIMNVC